MTYVINHNNGALQMKLVLLLCSVAYALVTHGLIETTRRFLLSKPSGTRMVAFHLLTLSDMFTQVVYGLTIVNQLTYMYFLNLVFIESARGRLSLMVAISVCLFVSLSPPRQIYFAIIVYDD